MTQLHQGAIEKSKIVEQEPEAQPYLRMATSPEAEHTFHPAVSDMVDAKDGKEEAAG